MNYDLEGAEPRWKVLVHILSKRWILSGEIPDIYLVVIYASVVMFSYLREGWKMERCPKAIPVRVARLGRNTKRALVVDIKN